MAVLYEIDMGIWLFDRYLIEVAIHYIISSEVWSIVKCMTVVLLYWESGSQLITIKMTLSLFSHTYIHIIHCQNKMAFLAKYTGI